MDSGGLQKRPAKERAPNFSEKSWNIAQEGRIPRPDCRLSFGRRQDEGEAFAQGGGEAREPRGIDQADGEDA